MSTVIYAPAPGYDASETGLVNIGGGIAFDVHAALVAGGGQITVDTVANPALVSALDHYPGLVRSGGTPGPNVGPTAIVPLFIHSEQVNAGQLIQMGTDGVGTAAANPYGATQITGTKTAAYTASPGDIVPVDLSNSSFTVTLPTRPADKTQIAVTVVGQASIPNTVTIAAGGSDVFNASTATNTLTLKGVLESVTLQYQLSTGVWLPTASSNLAGRALNAARTGTDTYIGGMYGDLLNPAMVGTASVHAELWQPNKFYPRGYTILDHIAIADPNGPRYVLRQCNLDHTSPAALSTVYPWGANTSTNGVQWTPAPTNGSFRGPFQQSVPSQLAAINNQLGLLTGTGLQTAGANPVTSLAIDASAFPNPPGNFQVNFAQAITIAYASAAIPVSANFAVASFPNLSVSAVTNTIPIAPTALPKVTTNGLQIASGSTVTNIYPAAPLTQDVYANELLSMTDTNSNTVQTFTVTTTLRASISQQAALIGNTPTWLFTGTLLTSGTWTLTIPTGATTSVTITGIAWNVSAATLASAVQTALVAAGFSTATVAGAGGNLNAQPILLTLTNFTPSGAMTVNTAGLNATASLAVLGTVAIQVTSVPAAALFHAGSSINVAFPAGSTISLHNFYGQANPQYTPEDIVIGPNDGLFYRALYSNSGNAGVWLASLWASLGYKAVINQQSHDVQPGTVGQPDIDYGFAYEASARSRFHIPRSKPLKTFATLADFDLGISGNANVTSICGQHPDPDKNAGTPLLYYGVKAAWSQVADISNAYVRVKIRVPGQGSAQGQARAAITHTYLEVTSDAAKSFTICKQYDLVPNADVHLPEDVYSYSGCGPLDWVQVGAGTTDLTAITAMRFNTTASNTSTTLAPAQVEIIPVNGQTITVGGRPVVSRGDGIAKCAIWVDDSDISLYTLLADYMNALGFSGTVAAAGAVGTGGANPNVITPAMHSNLRLMGWKFAVHYHYANDGDDPWCQQPPVLGQWIARAKHGLNNMGVYGVDDYAWHDTLHMNPANVRDIKKYFRTARRYSTVEYGLGVETLPPMEPYSVRALGISGATIGAYIMQNGSAVTSGNSWAATINSYQAGRLNFNLAAGSPLRVVSLSGQNVVASQLLTVAGASAWNATSVALTSPPVANATYAAGTNTNFTPGLGLLSGTALSTTAQTTSLNIAPFYKVYAGQRITLINGNSQSQTWTVATTTNAGAGPIPVVGQIANFAYPGDGTTFAYLPGASWMGLVDLAILAKGLVQFVFDPSVTVAEGDVVQNILYYLDAQRANIDTMAWPDIIKPWLEVV